jgi:hypothetical protein
MGRREPPSPPRPMSPAACASGWCTIRRRKGMFRRRNMNFRRRMAGRGVLLLRRRRRVTPPDASDHQPLAPVPVALSRERGERVEGRVDPRKGGCLPVAPFPWATPALRPGANGRRGRRLDSESGCRQAFQRARVAGPQRVRACAAQGRWRAGSSEAAADRKGAAATPAAGLASSDGVGPSPVGHGPPRNRCQPLEPEFPRNDRSTPPNPIALSREQSGRVEARPEFVEGGALIRQCPATDTVPSPCAPFDDSLAALGRAQGNR